MRDGQLPLRLRTVLFGFDGPLETSLSAEHAAGWFVAKTPCFLLAVCVVVPDFWRVLPYPCFSVLGISLVSCVVVYALADLILDVSREI